MSNLQDEILLNDYALNQDDDYRYLPKGSAPFALNILKSEDGAGYIITNLKGNKKVTYVPPTAHPLLNANVYFTLSSCYDPLTRNVYYWIFTQPVDTSGSGDYEYDNRLLRFNEETEIIDTIFVDYVNYFGLDPLKPFKDSFVLGTWLYFNPRESEPKMIDIDMAYNYTNYNAYDSTLTYVYGQKVTYFGGLFMALDSVAVAETPVNTTTKWERIGDAYQNETALYPAFDSEFRYAFNVLRQIPVQRPTCTYATDDNKNANNVRGKLFRFACRYKYFDNTYSRYGAYSDITLPLYDEYYNGEIPNDIDQYNCIDVNIPLHSAALIDEVDIIFQETGGDWKRAKIVNRKDIDLLERVYYSYRFYNTDSAFESIDDTGFSEPYDAVPRKANSQEIINKNILLYGGCTEGFKNIPKEDIDVSLTPEIEAITIAESKGAWRRDNLEGYPTSADWSLGWTPTSTWMKLSFLTWYFEVAAGYVFIIKIDGKIVSYTVQAADVADLDSFIDAIYSFLKTNFPTLTVLNMISEPAIQILGMTSIDYSVFYEPSGVSEVALTKARGFKTGAWHPFCIFYYDGAMRRWEAQTSKDNLDGTTAWEILGTTVYVPMLGEYSPPLGSTAYKWNINWEVNHLPPVNDDGSVPKYWRWGYAGNSLCSYFVQYVAKDFVNEGTTWTYIDITPLQTLKDPDSGTWNEFPQSIIDPYEWVKGDRVRIITEAAIPDDYLGDPLDNIFDYEIVKYDDTTVDGEYRIYIQYMNPEAYSIGAGSLIEIYRPTKANDIPLTFYEFGEIMPIITDSAGEYVHGCGAIGTQNQDTGLDLPATGTFTSGDVYHILRTPSYPIDTIEGYFHESMWYSDFYKSDDWDRGRTGEETSFGERFLNIIRYSNQYLQNTMINGLSTFRGMNYVELNDIYGEILRIIENGDTLKVYQRKKPSSFLIGKTQYYDAEGNPNVQAVSDRVLSLTPRYSTTNYGTEYPESIERNNRYIYGFDVYNGVLWRDSPNGIFPISGRYEDADGGGDYKMETYFKAKAKALLVNGIENTQVLITWDERHKNLYVVFKDNVNADNDEAIIFHEPSNKWICFTDMDYTPTEGWNQILELDYWVLSGFEGGIGFEFDADSRFAIFDIETGGGADAYIEGTLIVDEDGTTYIVTDSGEYIIE